MNLAYLDEPTVLLAMAEKYRHPKFLVGQIRIQSTRSDHECLGT